MNKIAVLISCYTKESTIEKVIKGLIYIEYIQNKLHTFNKI